MFKVMETLTTQIVNMMTRGTRKQVVQVELKGANWKITITLTVQLSKTHLFQF